MNELENIFCKLFDRNRQSLYLDSKDFILSQSQLNRLEKILEKRIQGDPLQYLLGDTDFMGITLKVSPDVLIPRPETEILVEEALKYLEAQNKYLKILDIGTGSGNIPIALAKSSYVGRFEIFSVDISSRALKVARMNARLNKVVEKISFMKSDIFSAFENNEKFDCIISNPPYIKLRDYDSLPIDVKREPSLALLAGEDGLFFHRKIEEGAHIHLADAGKIFLEIGYDQKDAISAIFGDSSVWENIEFIKDLCGFDRVAVIKKH